MGHNATVVVMLDALHEIENDPEFGKNLANAILMECGARRSSRTRDVPAGNHCNAATVIEEHHSSQTVLVAVGGNYGTVMARYHSYKHHEEEDKLELLRSFAKSMGYYIAKYPKRTKIDETIDCQKEQA